MDTRQNARDIQEALAAPFGNSEIKCKPGVVSGNRALVLWYVDARTILDRLDAVMGIGNWRDDYEFLPDGSVICRLSLRIDGEWITKVDVGGASEQADSGDRHKAAVSDGLKRAAVHFGIGRHLYRLLTLWADFDQAKKRFSQTPQLPVSCKGVAPAVPGISQLVGSQRTRVT